MFGEIIRLKDRLGCEPSDEQLAISLKISRAELQAWLMECHLAREKLAMSNVRLVMSIAQRYDNMGAEMSDLVQVISKSCALFVSLFHELFYNKFSCFLL